LSNYKSLNEYWDILRRCFDLKQYGEAEKVLDEALEAHPYISWIHADRIMVYWLLRQYEKTADAIRKLLLMFGLNPDDHDFYYWVLGECYLKTGNYELAISSFSESMENGAMDDLPFTGRGIAYLKKGQLDKAITDFDQAVSTNSSRSFNYYQRAEYYIVTGNKELAICDLKKSIELTSEDRDKLVYIMNNSEILEEANKKLKVLNSGLPEEHLPQ
jgi:tetratricopeptide (TPR) repeat protein